MKYLLTSAALALTMAMGVLAEGVEHPVAHHVDQNDPKVMNMALNNVQNIYKYYQSVGDTVVI